MSKLFFFLILMTNFVSSFAAESKIDEQLLSTLSLREKIGQLCFVAAVYDEEMDKEIIQSWYNWQPIYRLDRKQIENLITEYHVGGIVFYGQYAHPKEAISQTKHFQSISNIPLLITLDAEVGLGSRLNDQAVMRFPLNMTLGATRNLDLVYQTGYEVGMQLKMIGVHVNFAPVVDINNNPNNPVIGMRSFGSNKENVSEMGIAYMKGLQDAGIIACAKHFPGHGDTSVDSHLALPLINHSYEHLKSNEFYPFQRLIDAGVESVMTAHLEIPALENEKGLPASLSKNVVSELLVKNMGFEGLIFTDALGMKGVADYFQPGEIELKALQAGNDVLLCPMDVRKVIERIEKAVKDGEITEQEIDRKVLKVLKAKKRAFEQTLEVQPDLEASLNSKAAQELRKTLFSKAITSLKSEPGFFENLLGSNAVVINTDPKLSDFENTLKKLTDIKVFQETLNDQSQSFSLFSFFKKFWNGLDKPLEKASHVVITVSRNSFENDVKIKPLLDLIEKFKATDKKVTVVLFCSPYLIPSLELADNVILAYEPVEGAQVAAAEVLSGIVKPEGVLPVEIELMTEKDLI